jgi:DNA (cytosine-5)-methyltransferase 1
MGVEPGHITAVPGLSRSDQLHCIGNGAVPQQAYAAYAYLLELMEKRVS